MNLIAQVQKIVDYLIFKVDKSLTFASTFKNTILEKFCSTETSVEKVINQILGFTTLRPITRYAFLNEF